MKIFCLLFAITLFAFFAFEIETAVAKDPICTVDVTAVPELTEYSKQLPALCEKNYPKIVKTLKSSGFNPPAKVKLIFRKQNNPGEALGDTVYLSIDWFKKYPDDLGAIVHELAHVVQSYPGGNTPFWLQEGLADFVRYKTGYQNEWSYPHCEQRSPHYTSGYWCGAAFLGFVEKNYKSKKVVNTINDRLRRQTYNDEAFKELTGKSLAELWKDCLQKDCKGGTP